MSAFARMLARISWWYMLKLMRQPWMKRLQKRWLMMVREHKREAAWQSVVRQNRLARKHGLTLLTFSFNVLLGSIFLTWAYFLLLHLQINGYLSPLDPEQLRASRR